jgi:hypothetical protein
MCRNMLSARASMSPRNAPTPTTPITPSRSAHARICSSEILRICGQTAYALECEKITGCSLSSMASSDERRPVCEQSTMMPTRPISRTTCRPKLLSPASATSAHPSATKLRTLYASSMCRTPSVRSASMRDKSSPIGRVSCELSPMTSLPCRRPSSISASVLPKVSHSCAGRAICLKRSIDARIPSNVGGQSCSVAETNV